MALSEPTYYDPYPRQATAHSAEGYAPARPARWVPSAEELPQDDGPRGIRLDGLAIAALIIIAFLALQSILDRSGDGVQTDSGTQEVGTAEQSSSAENQLESSEPSTEQTEESDMAPPLPPVQAADPYAISFPYDDYWITQGPHGFSYGHTAIDLAAGKGAPVKSPIHGQVTANYIDQYGNTTLVIENEVYQVTLLHGDFTAQFGQKVALGEVVGTEGNNGYTTDMQGRSCRNRDCGYHSHLNVFNKVIQSNVNPLEVLK